LDGLRKDRAKMKNAQHHHETQGEYSHA